MLADEISDVPNLGMNSYPAVRLGVVFAEISEADHVALLCLRRHRVSCLGGTGCLKVVIGYHKTVVK